MKGVLFMLLIATVLYYATATEVEGNSMIWNNANIIHHALFRAKLRILPKGFGYWLRVLR